MVFKRGGGLFRRRGDGGEPWSRVETGCQFDRCILAAGRASFELTFPFLSVSSCRTLRMHRSQDVGWSVRDKSADDLDRENASWDHNTHSTEQADDCCRNAALDLLWL